MSYFQSKKACHVQLTFGVQGISITCSKYAFSKLLSRSLICFGHMHNQEENIKSRSKYCVLMYSYKGAPSLFLCEMQSGYDSSPRENQQWADDYGKDNAPHVSTTQQITLVIFPRAITNTSIIPPTIQKKGKTSNMGGED